MLDYIELSQTTPCDEPCAQVGSENYSKNARFETQAYVNQLMRTLGIQPPDSFFKMVRCPHDFGTYLDIRFYYDNEDQRHVIFMMNVEAGCEKWDEAALNELNGRGYELPQEKV